MKFYIQSDKFIGFFQTPGRIQVGDTVYADSQKFADAEMTRPLGPSYAQYSVVASVPVNNGTFRVTAMSTRVLDFLADGIVVATGMSEQLWTLSPDTYQIVDSKVLSNRLTITGGSGKYIDACGSYDVQTLANGQHIGVVDKYCREKRLVYMDTLGYFAVGIALMLFYWWTSSRSRAQVKP